MAGTGMPNVRFVLRAEKPARVRAAVISTLRAIDLRVLVDLRTLTDAAWHQ